MNVWPILDAALVAGVDDDPVGGFILGGDKGGPGFFREAGNDLRDGVIEGAVDGLAGGAASGTARC